MVEPKRKKPSVPRNATGKEDKAMAEEARRILRSEMERRGYTFKMLSEALAATPGGEAEKSVQSLTNKVNRGRFSFAFFLRAVRVMGMTSVRVAEVDDQ